MEGSKMYSPAQLAPILGVSESTLKRWVDAGHLHAEKTAGGHRKISVPDLVGFLRSTGRPVPSPEALGLLADQARSPLPGALTPEALAGLLLAADVDAARRLLLDQFGSGRPLDEMLDRLVAPSMAFIGTQWAEGKVDVYEEHLATLRLYGCLLDLRGLIPRPSDTAALALGGAPEGDPYLLPTLMAEMTLAEMGWHTVNVGPDTPIGSFLEAIARHAPRLVWLSVTSLAPRRGFLEDYPRMFEAAQARGVSVMLGGQGLTPEMQDRLVASAFGTRLAHLKAFARSLGA